jgi:hypothetical protein
MSKTVSKSPLVKTMLDLCQQICGIRHNCEKNGNAERKIRAVRRIFLREHPVFRSGGNSEFAFAIKADV